MKYISIFFLIIFWSCNVLDKNDLGAVTGEALWNDKDYAKAYINKLCLDNLPSWDNNISGNSDEAFGGSSELYGQLTINSKDIWHYEQIRNINIFLDNIDRGTLSEDIKYPLIAQARFLRAWRYFQMVRVYGGIPIIEKPQSIDDDLYVSRNKTSECIRFIISDLEYAANNLPWRWTGVDEGRLTKAAALALIGRVKLYYASPQFNPNRDMGRWTDAYEACKIAVDELRNNGYDLYENYEGIWFEEMNKEVVMVQRFQEPGRVHNWDAATRPLSEAQNATGANQPTWNIVQSYTMKNGLPINNPKSGYDPIFYWKNRDPRFNTTIANNGCLWELSGKAGRKQWTYVGAEVNNPTQTGFYCRKAINKSYSPYFTERSSTDWIEIRFAEVLLNYAECAAELGKVSEAYDVLKLIRKRAGIDSGSDQMYGLREDTNIKEVIKSIIDERKIELAFEGKRYWDLRRRRLFADELNGIQREGILPLINLSQDEIYDIRENIDINSEYFVFFRDSVVLVDKVFKIDFKENYYFNALPIKHLENNPNLKQTLGWDGGSFDPLD